MPGGNHLLPPDSRLWTDHDAHHAHRLPATIDAMPGPRNPVPDHRRRLRSDHDPEYTHRVSGGSDDSDIVPGRPNDLPESPNDLPGGNRLRRDDLSAALHVLPAGCHRVCDPAGPDRLPDRDQLRTDDLSGRLHPVPEHPVHGMSGG